MADTVIRVENLGKKYTLAHQQEGKRYRALRDVLANQTKSIGRRFKSFKPYSSRPTPHAPAQEEFWALKDVSFEIKQGDRVGIIGRNGAGKSTLLKILSRITEPTTGRISIKGRVASLLEVGTGFHPELTGRENIFLNGAILGMSRVEIKRKFDEIVAFAEVEKFLDTPVKRYSSGMYVRLAFAVAAHLEPEILIVDEVLAVGDAAFQKKCLGKMEDVAEREGRTVLFVSHNMAAIQQLTNLGILLQNGHSVKVSDTKTVIETYLSHEERASSIYYIENVHRRFSGMSRKIEFLSVEFLNSTSNLFKSDSDIILKFTVSAREAINEFRFNMTFFRIDETPVGSFFGHERESLQKGEIGSYKLTLSKLNLAPGKYHCTVAVGKGHYTSTFEDFDVIFDVLHFEVMPPEGIDGTQALWHDSWGPIRLN
ncbi:MAG: ABC transporter ATP-binding protein, partial [Nodosilinea sp.]